MQAYGTKIERGAGCKKHCTLNEACSKRWPWKTF